MTDTTMQLLSQGTDPVKMPDFDILAEGKTLSGVAERLMSLSLTDKRIRGYALTGLILITGKRKKSA